MQEKKIFLKADDICSLCDISLSSAYKIIRTMNKELEGQGFFTLAGKVPAAYFYSRMYGGAGAETAHKREGDAV